MELPCQVYIRKITDTAIEEWMKNVQLAPQDQLMVATYIYPESDLFNINSLLTGAFLFQVAYM